MSASDGTRSRPRRRWIWAIVALATVGVLIAPVAFLLGPKGGLHHEYGPVTVYHHAVTAVEVRAPGDTVAISAGRPDQVSVASVVAWNFAKPAVHETWHGTTLAVSVRCPAPEPFEDCLASLTVRVPAAAGVRAAIGTGTATVTGLAGPVRVTATSGSLVLANLTGPLWATATAGSITGQSGLKSRALTAVVGSGSLALRLDSAPRSLSLAVGSGSGQVTVPAGARYRIDPRSGSGTVYLSPGLSNPDSASRLAAEVGTGTLTIGAHPARTR